MYAFHLFSVLLLFFPTTILAQNATEMGAGHMNMPMKGEPMVEKVEDNRQVVPLTEPETVIVLKQMRQMLASVQGVTDGLARGDTLAVIEAASKSGMSMMQGLPKQIRMKFPPPFRLMGMASHRAFDKIVGEAGSAKDSAPILKLLSESIQNCVACHAIYRFALPKN